VEQDRVSSRVMAGKGRGALQVQAAGDADRHHAIAEWRGKLPERAGTGFVGAR